LKGSITVTVAKIMPGGNLYVQGEKWIKINQGDEYIRVRGIIRPTDITRSNTVLSTQLADARISYGGTGTLAQSNSAGWLSRFFLSPLWPF
jgi:flagellar L-ring protein precursor FlgH